MNKQLLEQPFLTDQIKEMQGRSGKTLQYVEGHVVIARLNEALGNDGWSFTVVSHQILEHEVIVLGELTVGRIKKSQFGAVAIAKSDAGEVLSIGTDLMSAATCSLKKCASMLGVALYLCRGKENGKNDEPSTSPPERSDSSSNVSSTSNNNRLSRKQHDYLLQLAALRGLSKEEANEQVVSSMGLPINMLSKQEASYVIQQMLN